MKAAAERREPASTAAEKSPGRDRRRVRRQVLADLALLSVAAVWGGTFVMVKDAVAAYPVFGFLALRFTFAALALAPLALWQNSPHRPGPSAFAGRPAKPWAPPLLVGLALFAGYGLQTLGLHLTTPAKTGFITGLYVVLVPLLAALLLRERPGWGAWLGVALAAAGLALLSWEPGQGLSPGDALVLGATLAWAAQILLTERFAPRVSAVGLTFGQILTAAALSWAASILWEVRPALTPATLSAAAFTGLLATSAAFGIQTVAQRFTTATHTALIFASETVFAALFSYLLIGEVLGARQLAGCGLILAAMLAVELIARE